MPKGAREGSYGAYEYIKAPGKYRLQMPPTPGEYELRIAAAVSPYKTLAAKPITLTAVDASVKAPASVAAGASFEVSWTGPNNDRDYVAIGETQAGGRPYLDYKYTRVGSPLQLSAPEKPGSYEVRYFLGAGDSIVARQTIAVGEVTATLSAPATVAAGAKFSVKWTGPDNPRDFVTVVKAGTVERTYQRYEYTANGNPLVFTAPDIAGAYEIRYATGKNYLTLARAALTVGAVSASLSGPAQAVAGESFPVTWKGPDNPRNFITVVAKGAHEGAFTGSYGYTAKKNPMTLVAPPVAGDYELRYYTAETYQTLARADVKVTPAKQEAGRVAVTLAGNAQLNAASNGAVEIILDASGSMLQKLGTQRRIDIARQMLDKLTSSTIPAGTPFAMRVFGREVDSCQTDLDVPLGPLNRAAVAARINALVAKNGAKTPIGASLENALDDLKSATGERLIVLVTDGEETCGGDPLAAIEKLRAAGIGTRVSIVGFALDDAKLAATFRRWSDGGGGAFFDAKDGAGLDKALTESLRPGFEVLNAQGQLLASGIVNGEAVQVPSGTHTVRIKGRATVTKPVTVKPKETSTVAF